MTSIAYLNGEFRPLSECTISALNGGWLHGAGLFETMRAENGRAFRLAAHLDRLCHSAARIMAPITLDDLPSADVFQELMARNGLKTARLRLTVSAGSMLEDEEKGKAVLTVCATASELGGYAADLYQRGVQVMICPFRVSPSDPLAGHKTTSYLPRLLGLREARQARCQEAVWFTTGNRLAEGSISNIFLVRSGKLVTPPLDTPVLPGTTRSLVLDLAAERGIENEETPLVIDDLLDADEVLLTNAIMQVMPVTRVERHDIKDGKIGPLARQLLDAYRDRVRKECGD